MVAKDAKIRLGMVAELAGWLALAGAGCWDGIGCQLVDYLEKQKKNIFPCILKEENNKYLIIECKYILCARQLNLRI